MNASTQNVTESPKPQARTERRLPTVIPDVDVFESENELLLVADVPGAATDTVDVSFDKGRLTLSATRAGTAQYHRVFTVPTSIDPSKVSAELRGGVLTVKLPKSEALKPRKIEVKAG